MLQPARIQIIITGILLSFMLSVALPAQIRVAPGNVDLGEKEYSPHLNDNWPSLAITVIPADSRK